MRAKARDESLSAVRTKGTMIGPRTTSLAARRAGWCLGIALAVLVPLLLLPGSATAQPGWEGGSLQPNGGASGFYHTWDGGGGCGRSGTSSAAGNYCNWGGPGLPGGATITLFRSGGRFRDYGSPLGARSWYTSLGQAEADNGFGGANQWGLNAGDVRFEFRQTSARSGYSRNPSNTYSGGTSHVYSDLTPPSLSSPSASCAAGANGWCRTDWTLSAHYHNNTPINGQAQSLSFQVAPWGSGSWSGIGSSYGTETSGVAFQAVGYEDGWGNYAVVGIPGGPFKIDKTAPSAPALDLTATAQGSGGTSTVTDQNVFNYASQIVVAPSGSSDSLSGVWYYQYRQEGAAGQADWTQASSRTITSEGTTTVCFRAIDQAGNTGGETCAAVRIDRAPPPAPTVALSSGSDGVWNNAAEVILTPTSVDAGQGVARYQYSLGSASGPWTNAPGQVGGIPRTYTVSNEGTTVVCFRAVDAFRESEISGSTCVTVKLDQTPPCAPTVTGGSLIWQQVSSLTISASGCQDIETASVSPYLRTEYQQTTSGDTSWSAVTTGSSHTFADDGEGWARFRVRDVAGNASAWAPSFTESGATSANAAGVSRIDNSAPVGDPDPPSTPRVWGGGTDTWSNGPEVISASDSFDRATALWLPGTYGSFVESTTAVPDIRNSSVTLEYWLKFNAVRGWTHGSYVCPVQIYTDAITTSKVLHTCIVSEENNGPNFYGTFWGVNTFTGSGVIKPGEWMHIAFTYDMASDTERLYVNGIQRGAQGGSSGPLIGTVTPRIRLGQYEWSNFLAGGLDDVALYNRALTPAEVWMRARPDAAPITNGRVAYWALNRLPSGFTSNGKVVFGPGGATNNPLPPSYEYRTSEDGGTTWTGPQPAVNTAQQEFRPDMIRRMSLWLDASDAATRAPSADGEIGLWEDKAYPDHDAEAQANTERPKVVEDALAGKPVVRFDGGDRMTGSAYLVRPATTTFAVMRYANNTSRMAAFDLAQQSGGSYRHFALEQNTFSTAGNRYGFYASGNSLDSATPTSDGTKLFSLVAGSGESASITGNTSYFVNGSLSALNVRTGGNIYANTNGLRGYRLGDFYMDGSGWGAPFTGDIAEVIVYPSTLTASERQRVEGYLAHKWGLTGQLPTDHPFKSAPPTVEQRAVTVTRSGTTNVQFRAKDGNGNASPWSTAYANEVIKDEPRGWWRGRGDAPNSEAYKKAIQDMDPWGYWTMDEKSGTTAYDSGRWGRNGTYGNSVASPGAGANAPVYTVAIQGDGKPVLTGEFTAYRGATANRVVRLNADGTLDTEFLQNIGSAANSWAFRVATQSDGKIIVTGDFTTWNGATVNRIVRLNADGTRDATFTTNVGSAANSYPHALAVQPDGKILVGGAFTTWNGTTVNGIVRLNTDGTRDTAFNTSTGSGTGGTRILNMALQSDGKIVLGGDFTTWNGAARNRIVRLLSTGAVDSSFNTNLGTGPNVQVADVASQSDGKVIAVGDFTTWNGVAVNRVVRLNADGSRDTAFATAMGSGPNAVVNFAALQGDRIILTGSFTSFNGSSANRLVRLTSTGAPDTAYVTNNNGGANDSTYRAIVAADGTTYVLGAFTQFGSSDNGTNRIVKLSEGGVPDASFTMMDDYSETGMNNTATGAAFDASGREIITGAFTTYRGRTVNRVVRLQNSGRVDIDFANAMRSADNSTYGANGGVNGSAVQPDGKVVLGGDFTSFGANTVNRLVRLNADGTNDTAFVANVGSGANAYIGPVVRQADGKILVGGNFSSWNGNATYPYLVRLNADGTRDPTFAAMTGINGAINSIAVQNDGRIVVGGNFTTWGGASVGRVVRLEATGARDTAFTTANGTGAGGVINGVALQSDGKIILTGNIATWNGSAAGLIVRLTTTGARDTAFDTSLGSGFAGPSAETIGVRVDSSDRILVAGSFTTLSGRTANRIARLLSTGAPDLAFNRNTGLASDNTLWTAAPNPVTGKILVLGNVTTWNGLPARNILRLNADGTRDTAFNGTELGTPARPGTKGIVFTGAGNQGLNIPTYSPADGNRNYTVGAWVKFPLPNYGHSWWTLARGDSDHQLIINYDGRLGMYDNTSGGGFRTSGYTLPAGLSGWHHLAVVGRGGQDTGGQSLFYLDGAEVTSIGFKSRRTITGIGWCSACGSQGFGSLDEAVLFDRALNPYEIQRLAGVATMRDATGNATNGAWFGTMAFDGTGPFTQTDPGGAVYGDGAWGAAGDVKVDVPTTDFSYETWARTTNGGTLMGAASNDHGLQGSNDRVMYVRADGQACLFLWRSDYGENFCTADKNYNDGQWHHYVVTLESGRYAQLYVDGKPVAVSWRNQQSDFTTDTDLTVNGRGWTGEASRHSQADSVLYDMTLSAAEVAARYRARTVQLAEGTANIDTIAPTAPTVVGGQAVWGSSGRTISASGSTDAGGSGLARYQYRLSSDGGKTWGTARAMVAPATATANLLPQSSFDVDTTNVSKSTSAAETAFTATTADAKVGVRSLKVTTAGTHAEEGILIAQPEALNLASGTSLVGGAWLKGEGPVEVFVRLLYTDGSTADSTRQATTLGSNWVQVSVPAITATKQVNQARLYVVRPAAGVTTFYVDGAEVTRSVPANVAIASEGLNVIQARAVDGAGNVSAWAPNVTPPTEGSTNPVAELPADVVAPVDTTPPTTPTVTGGSLAWASVAARTVTASGSTDAGSGGVTYQRRVSTDGGATWQDPIVTASSETITREGETLVQFRARDALGNASAWVPSFASAGALFDGAVSVMTPQSDNQVLVGGSFTAVAGASAGRLARLSAIGSAPDTAFAANIGTGANGPVYAIAVQADGRILVGGDFTMFNGRSAPGLARLRADGTFDASFAVGLGAAPNGARMVRGVALQPDDKVIVTGNFPTWDGATVNHIVRLNTDGARDTTFATGTGADQMTYDAQVLPDGRIVVVGNFTTWNGTGSINRIVRLNADGTRDTATTFNANLGTASPNSIFHIVRQSDGKLLLAGAFATFNSAATNFIVRLNADGTRDATFALNGSAVASGLAYGLTLQPDGKILVGGNFDSFGGGAAPRLIRLLTDGTVDTAFRTAIGTNTNGNVTAFAVRPDGRILVGGEFTAIAGTTDRYLAILQAGGAPCAVCTVSASNAAGVVRIDRTAPTTPQLAGGSLSWSSGPNATVTATGATDALSGGVTYEYRTSPPRDLTPRGSEAEPAWGPAQSGKRVTVSTEGETWVQFRAIDAAGNRSDTLTASGTALPSNTTPPSILIPSLLDIGQTVTASVGTWEGSPSSYTYEWQRSADDGATWGAIDGETFEAYQIASTDLGKQVRVAIRATNGAGTSVGFGSILRPREGGEATDIPVALNPAIAPTCVSASATSLECAWPAASPPPGKTITGYRVYVNGGLAATTSAASATVEGLTGGARHIIGVSAYGSDWESTPGTTTATPWAAPVATVIGYAGSGAVPAGWLEADGSAVSRATYAALYAAVCPANPAGATAAGTSGCPYGTPDKDSFFLPDMKGRIAVGLDPGQTAFDSLGETGGSLTETILSQHLPTNHSHGGGTDAHGGHSHGGVTGTVNRNASHRHTGTPTTGGGGWSSDTDAIPPHNCSVWGSIQWVTSTTDTNHLHGVTDGGSHNHELGSSGLGESHSNLQPYLVGRYLIAMNPTTAVLPAKTLIPSASAATPAGYVAANGSGGAPDMRARALVGQDASVDSFDTLGEVGGSLTVSLTTAQLPAHTHVSTAQPNHSHGIGWMNSNASHRHGATPTTGGGGCMGGYTDAVPPHNGVASGGGWWANYVDTNHEHSISSDGGHSATAPSQGLGSGHNNMQPYLVANYLFTATHGQAPTSDMIIASAGVSAPPRTEPVADEIMSGRVAVGRDAAQPMVQTLKQTGGAVAHALAADEMAAHSHSSTASVGDHNHGGATGSMDRNATHRHRATETTGGGGWCCGLTDGVPPHNGSAYQPNGYWVTHYQDVNHNHSIPAQVAHSHALSAVGSGTPHNELQPYMALRMVQVPAAATSNPPAMTIQPSYTRGIVVPGALLSADPGTWSSSSSLTYRYQWLRCGPAGDNCTAVSERSTTSAYLLSASDFGQTVRVMVLAAGAGGESDPVVSQPLAVNGPRSTQAPTISGTAAVGQTLTTAPGTWSASPRATIAYQWQRCTDAIASACEDIPSATAVAYAVQAADAGRVLRVRETATNSWGSATSFSSFTSEVNLTRATGGSTVYDAGEWRIHRFNGPGTFTVAAGQNIIAEYLVVAGGGGGGMDMGGGGGAGGVLQGTATFAAGQAYAITVGNGGTGAPAACTSGQPCGHQYTISAQNGGNSAISGSGVSVTSIGGGRGGSSYWAYTPGPGGASGGSGGGASAYTDGNRTGQGVGGGTAGQGNNGGGAGVQYYGGGGGGAGAAGQGSGARAHGGIGIQSSILGTSYYFAGGGGGSGYSAEGGNGGLGGGGGGAACTATWFGTGGGSALNAGSNGGNGCNQPGGDAGVNTGGGGGGSSHYNSNNRGGNGGSGIVVIRYRKFGGYVNQVLPTISGSGVWGEPMTAEPGTWAGQGSAPTYRYEWHRCDANGNSCVSTGSASKQYTPSRLDAGATLRVKVIADNSTLSDPAWSAPSREIAAIQASGGETSDVGQWRIHRFNASGTFTLSTPQDIKVEYLVVAGGGGGGMDMGGGGGGGGFVEGMATIGSGVFQVNVGAGGRGAPAGCTTTDLGTQPCGHWFSIAAQNGGDSWVRGPGITTTAVGGGRGGSSYINYTPGAAGASGGSGGGASGYMDGCRGGWGVGGSTYGQGNNGGSAGCQYYSGGGGGAGGAGASGNNQPHGGAGRWSSILGTSYMFAGGGGGAGYSGCGGNGGDGGGGFGAICWTGSGNNGLEKPPMPSTSGCTNCWANVPGGRGGINTGGGGGGGAHYNAGNAGGNGGSGIVVIRYKRF